MKVGRLHHSAFRAMWSDLVDRTAALARAEDRDNTPLGEARALCYILFRSIALHGKFENRVLFPALDAAKGTPDFTQAAVEQHRHEAGQMNELLARFDTLLAKPVREREAGFVQLASACSSGREAFFEHLAYEEEHFMPVLAELEVEQHLDLLKQAYEMCIVERPHLIGPLTSYMPIEDTLSLLDSLLHAVQPQSEQWHLLMRAMHHYLAPEQWLRVIRRFEDALPTSLMVLPSGAKRHSLLAAAEALDQAAPIDRIEI
jgi:hypothetical protein